jgi:oxaloacetate decarboxylase (Na+ extruding) subunit gamma
MDTEMLIESLLFMLIGMGIVFSFLLLLVGILRVMSWAALKLAPIAIEPEPMLAGRAADGAEAVPTAVIAAAIARYRADHPGRRR